jgi:hypothetical protein
MPYADDVKTIPSIQKRLTDFDGIIHVPFQIGVIGITTNGWSYNNASNRIRTPEGITTHLEVGDTITVASGAAVYVGALKSDGTYFDGGTWETGTYTITVEGDYVFVGKYTTEETVTDVDALASKVTVRKALSTKSDVESLVGTGNNTYTGDRIVLTNEDTRTQRCTINLWADYKLADIPTLADYRLDKNQSMTIYNGYVFMFNQGGDGQVIDYPTKEILSTFAVTPSANQHANSAQFTDIYYDASDDYPLIMLSRCGNADYVSGEHDLDEAQFYRVTQSGTTFTFTLINTIKLNRQTYGASWGIDNVNKRLYATATINGNWSVRENNPKMYWMFALPSATSIKSGSAITLNEADALSVMTIPFAIGQGLTVNGGVIYEGTQDVNGVGTVNNIWAVNLEKNRIVSKVPLISTYEPEGVAVYNGKLYVSQKSGADTTGTNPCKIYEVVF